MECTYKILQLTGSCFWWKNARPLRKTTVRHFLYVIWNKTVSCETWTKHQTWHLLYLNHLYFHLRTKVVVPSTHFTTHPTCLYPEFSLYISFISSPLSNFVFFFFSNRFITVSNSIVISYVRLLSLILSLKMSYPLTSAVSDPHFSTSICLLPSIHFLLYHSYETSPNSIMSSDLWPSHFLIQCSRLKWIM